MAVPAVVVLIGWGGIVAGSGPAPAAGCRGGLDGGIRPGRGQANRGGGTAGQAELPALIGPEPPRIVAFGDSVMVGAKEQLAARLGRGFSMNAKVGRQVDEVIALARKLKAGGHHPNDLIIQIGNNGPLYSEEMDALRTATSEAGHLFLINDHAPVSWVGESNEKLAQAAKEWPHTSLIDWSATAKTRGGLFWDGIHLTPTGASYTHIWLPKPSTPRPGPKRPTRKR